MRKQFIAIITLICMLFIAGCAEKPEDPVTSVDQLEGYYLSPFGDEKIQVG